MAGESALTHLSQRMFLLPSVVCRLNPQRLGAIALAFQVYFDLHFLLLFLGEPSNSNLNSSIEMMEAKTSRPPRKSPNIPPARSRAGKSSTGVSVAAHQVQCGAAPFRSWWLSAW
jgi:hypothetical protein